MSYLRADVSITCGDTPKHQHAKRLAAIAIAIYPAGLLFFNTLLLVTIRRAIRVGQDSPLSAAIGFLHHEYKAGLFAWELMEMTRRLVLVQTLDN